MAGGSIIFFMGRHPCWRLHTKRSIFRFIFTHGMPSRWPSRHTLANNYGHVASLSKCTEWNGDMWRRNVVDPMLSQVLSFENMVKLCSPWQPAHRASGVLLLLWVRGTRTRATIVCTNKFLDIHRLLSLQSITRLNNFYFSIPLWKQRPSLHPRSQLWIPWTLGQHTWPRHPRSRSSTEWRCMRSSCRRLHEGSDEKRVWDFSMPIRERSHSFTETPTVAGMSLGGIDIGAVAEFVLVLLQEVWDHLGCIGLGPEDGLVVDAQNRNLRIPFGQLGQYRRRLDTRPAPNILCAHVC